MFRVQKRGLFGVLGNEGESGEKQVNIVVVDGLLDDQERANSDSPRLEVGNPEYRTLSEQDVLTPSKGFMPATKALSGSAFERLSRDIPEARVFTFGCGADPIYGELEEEIKMQIWNEDPIIFVSHSSGEIAVQNAIASYEACTHRTKMILFLDTPNQRRQAKELVGKHDDDRKYFLESNDLSYRAVVNEFGIRVYRLQDADGKFGNAPRREIYGCTSESDFSTSMKTAEGIQMDQIHFRNHTESTEVKYKAVIGLIRDFILRRSENSEFPHSTDPPSQVKHETGLQLVSRKHLSLHMIATKSLCQICSNIHFKRVWDCGFTPAEVESYLKSKHLSLHEANLFFYPHHKSTDALEASAKNGCHFCIMLRKVASSDQNFHQWGIDWDAWEPLLPSEIVLFLKGPKLMSISSKGSSSIFVKCGRGGRPFRGEIGSTYEEAVRSGGLWPITFHEDTRTLIAPTVPDRETCSLANIALANIWLQDCLDHHRICDLLTKNTVFPRRLVDLSYPDVVRLVESDGLQGQYVALSYKWGGIAKSITTLENYSQRKCLLAVEDLPKTFRDAIVVTRGLGIKYLWIDALCIIQNSREDLETEIELMDQVYQNASLTIFASAAEDVDTGLSFGRDPLETRPCQLDVKFTNHGQTLLMTTNVSFFKDLVPLGQRPLFLRGWVLQEQILSRRCLIFGARFVSWECLCNHSSEKWPTVTVAETSKVDTSVTDSISRMRLALHQQQKREMTSRDFHWWYDMVENYSQRILSNPTDVLRALTGLANITGRTHQLSYVAGLWLEDLQVGLSWFVHKRDDTQESEPSRSEGSPSNHLGPYPSWSWASRWGCNIAFRGKSSSRIHLECELLRAEDEKGDSTRIRGLRVRGLMKAGIARWLPNHIDNMREVESIRAASCFHSAPGVSRWLPEGGHLSGARQPPPMWVGSVHDVESGTSLGTIAYDEEPENSKDLFINCLLCSEKTDPASINVYVRCLALVPTSELNEEYRRIGIVFIKHRVWEGSKTKKKHTWTHPESLARRHGRPDCTPIILV